MSIDPTTGRERISAGVDWAKDDHAVCVVGADGEVLDQFSVRHDAAGLKSMVTRLLNIGVGQAGIERPDGPVVTALAQAGLMTFRWGADKQLRDALCDFAGDSRRASPWAADLYNKAIARGHDHPHAVRILARAWAHIIWRCWHDHAPYNPAAHRALQNLINQQQLAAA